MSHVDLSEIKEGKSFEHKASYTIQPGMKRAMHEEAGM